jgi:large subunit ribosomal protein L21
MYAIFQSGGRQHRAEPGTVIKLEKLPGEVGGEVSLDQVILLADEDQVRVGQPVLEDVSIRGRIVEQGRHRKIIIFKHKRRKDYRKKQGHRQYYTAVLIQGIEKELTESPQAALSTPVTAAQATQVEE